MTLTLFFLQMSFDGSIVDRDYIAKYLKGYGEPIDFGPVPKLPENRLNALSQDEVNELGK